MRLMDRHIAAIFLRTFAICFISFAGLFVVIDAFQNLDSFLEHGRAHGRLLETMGKYYYYRCLMTFEMTAPLLTLVAAMFAVGALQRWNELTALMAAGLPKRRILAPIIVSAASVFLATAILREAYLPLVRDEAGIGRNAQNLAGDVKSELSPVLDEKTGIWFKGEGSLLSTRTIVNPDFRLPPALAEYGDAIRGAEATYLERSDKHPQGYLVRKATQPAKLLAARGPRLPDAGPIIITPVDSADFLQADECFVATEITFDQWTGGSTWRKYGSIQELISAMRNTSFRAADEIEYVVHTRFLQPLLDMTLLLLGLPLMVANHRRNIWASLAQCMVMVASFVICQQVCQQLATQKVISAALGAWCPLIIFVPLAALTSEPLWEWNDEPRRLPLPLPV